MRCMYINYNNKGTPHQSITMGMLLDGRKNKRKMCYMHMVVNNSRLSGK